MTSSLARRVALQTALAVAVTGVLVVVVAGVLLERLAADETRRRLEVLASTAATVENEEEAGGERYEELDARLAAGAWIAVYEDGRFVEGERRVPRVTPGGCEERGGLVACAHAERRVVAIAATSLEPLRALRRALAWAGLVAVLVTTLLGAAASFGLARWSLRPLARLRDAAERVTATRAAAELGAPEGVAEVDALRSALASAFGRLGVALAQSDRFAADAAHELRTPLTTILGELELLHEDLRADPESAAVVARVRVTAQRLATLVERLLHMARAAGPLALDEPVDIVELLEDVVLALPADARARVRLDATPPVSVRGDRALLVALAGNAVENALKYSGTGAVTVRIGATPSVAFVEVDDEGPGVPPAERERVFLPFHRGGTARTAKVAGHGVGLALVARVAGAHNGRAFFVDRDHGARLRVELPFGVESAEP